MRGGPPLNRMLARILTRLDVRHTALAHVLGAQWLAIVFNGALSFALSVLIARSFGPELFGVYATAVALGGLLSVLVDCGFCRLLQREQTRATPDLAVHAGDLGGYAVGHALRLLLGLAVAVVLLPLPFHMPTLLAALGAFGTAVMGQFGLSLLRGDGRFVKDAGWQVASRLLTAACIVGALLAGADQPWQVLAAQLLGAAAFVLVVLKSLRVRPAFDIPWRLYRRLLPLVWLDLATVVYFRADMLLAKLLGVPNAEVGYYGVAFRILEAFLLLASPVSLILFRKFRIVSGDAEAAIRQVPRPTLAAALVGLAIAFGLWLFGERLIVLAYGDAYRPAGPLLAILGCTLIFAVANGVLNQAALALGCERACALSASAAALVNVVGNLVLLPLYGVTAAAWLTAATEVVLGAGVAGALWSKWKQCRSNSRVV